MRLDFLFALLAVAYSTSTTEEPTTTKEVPKEDDVGNFTKISRDAPRIIAYNQGSLKAPFPAVARIRSKPKTNQIGAQIKLKRQYCTSKNGAVHTESDDRLIIDYATVIETDDKKKMLSAAVVPIGRHFSYDGIDVTRDYKYQESDQQIHNAKELRFNSNSKYHLILTVRAKTMKYDDGIFYHYKRSVMHWDRSYDDSRSVDDSIHYKSPFLIGEVEVKVDGKSVILLHAMGLLACVNPFGILQDFLADCFYKYGLFISKHPRAFALGPLVLTSILAFGVFNVRMEDDLRFLYSPEHSRSRVEYQVHKNFTGASSNNSFVSVTVESMDDDKNLLNKEKCHLIRMLNKYVLENMTININNEKVTVMPFIALAIGVDDVYVMLGAWQDTRRTLSPEKRMALALEEAGRY
ncbi:hypothetical protein OESDEN_06018 [Oesophagostomum dentatum]|uniref:SSD domain-containing protein n=1 Tax=Oesophagostomum dentatum TaxID=61180 RepID=A0A0B1TE08_OESDE|nr:hypothetical protein OESDEN_06018 [Oesophagostomum dentatum]